MSKQELIEKMLSDKAKSNNTICLNAYAIGLGEMYEQLRQYNVVGQGEQLVCDECNFVELQGDIYQCTKCLKVEDRLAN